MKKSYIVLLKNSYLLFSTKKPKKKGNFTNDVKLFETDENSSCQEICKWVESNHKLPSVKEVEEWE